MALETRRGRAGTGRRRQRPTEESASGRPREEAGPTVTLGDEVGEWPILECLVARSLFQDGIGDLMVAREGPQGRVAVASFVVDVYCLGVKDAFFTTLLRSDYDRRIRQLGQVEPMRPVTAEYARRLVEEAARFARSHGFEPHHDYGQASAIFGDTNAGACHEQFEFGCDGKPLYVPGPEDEPSRQAEILGVLSRRLGPRGFHFVIPVWRDNGQ